MEPGSDLIHRTRLDSGLRVVTESLPGLRSASIGFWVGAGARVEPVAEAGASHFLEHLLFKGTEHRGAAAIAEAIESVGGDMNAFTSHELVAFTVRVPDEHLELALEVLSDVMWRPALRHGDVEAERQVILEELHMRDDAPDDLVHDELASVLFPNHPLGRAVLGTDESIRELERDVVAQHHSSWYVPAQVVVAAAGNIGHDQVTEMIESRLPESGGALREPPVVPMNAPEPLVIIPRDIEQVHLAFGVRGLARDDPDRYVFAVLDQALGGGMSSRLFQEVRERRGLAYAVYSYRAAYRETGMLAAYVGTAPEHVNEVVAIVTGELDRLVADRGLPSDEIERAKGHLRGGIALSLESSSSRMHRLGRTEVTLGEIPTLDDIAAAIESVTVDDVARVVERVLVDSPRSLAVVGPCDDASIAERVA